MLALTADALADECLVVGSVGDGRELLAEAERLHPDIIVLDITMPRLGGIEAARQLRHLERPARLVFLTVHEDADYARAALDAGGLGYVVKTRLASDLLPAIRAALINQTFVSPAVRFDEPRSSFSRSSSKTNTIIPKTMKQILSSLKILSAIALLAVAVGCANTVSTENMLVAAGFKVITPKTAAQQQRLKASTDKVTSVQRSGKTYYVFPDFDNNQAYVGGPKQYQEYRQLRLQKQMADEKLETAEINMEDQMAWDGWGRVGRVGSGMVLIH